MFGKFIVCGWSKITFINVTIEFTKTTVGIQYKDLIGFEIPMLQVQNNAAELSEKK